MSVYLSLALEKLFTQQKSMDGMRGSSGVDVCLPGHYQEGLNWWLVDSGDLQSGCAM
jgi:hypothetical protein